MPLRGRGVVAAVRAGGPRPSPARTAGSPRRRLTRTAQP
ncbi:MAG: hypothetical protein AVDCRST_MAG66-1590 [uncultured Pseudonocardia sp.]|uniref:Uncharacterized protein n=1 Tax=uncultured Pseudonocardia sp. TaxID=211455 RepID=A0A6J4P4V3_9PSEU|nr:MAG: hypothetical protein AVDCRST_MAG66-1590 [uncultured Pseudonocardia sp.]